MNFLAILLIQSDCVICRSISWQEQILNKYSPENYKLLSTKKRIELVASLQLFNILSLCEMESKDLIHEKCANPEVTYSEGIIKSFTVLVFITLNKQLSQIKKSTIEDILKEFCSKLNSLFEEKILTDKTTIDYLTKLYEPPFYLVTGLKDLNSIYNDCWTLIEQTNMDENQKNRLQEKLKALKFLTRKEYESEEDLQALVKKISKTY